MYFILCGHPPFYGSTEKRILEKVVKGLYEFKDSEWEGISEDAKDLIRKLLEYDPEKRLSAEDALNHSWFAKTLGDGTIGNKNLAVKTLKNLENFRVKIISFFCSLSKRLAESYKKLFGFSWLHISQQKKIRENC